MESWSFSNVMEDVLIPEMRSIFHKIGMKRNPDIDRINLSNTNCKKEMLRKDGQGILAIIDGASVHNMPDLQRLSKSVIFLKLPPNTTAIIQPLDAGNLISSWKSSLSDHFTSDIMGVIKSGKTLPTVSEYEKKISEFGYSLQGMVMIIRKILTFFIF